MSESESPRRFGGLESGIGLVLVMVWEKEEEGGGGDGGGWWRWLGEEVGLRGVGVRVVWLNGEWRERERKRESERVGNIKGWLVGLSLALHQIVHRERKKRKERKIKGKKKERNRE